MNIITAQYILDNGGMTYKDVVRLKQDYEQLIKKPIPTTKYGMWCFDSKFYKSHLQDTQRKESLSKAVQAIDETKEEIDNPNPDALNTEQTHYSFYRNITKIIISCDSKSRIMDIMKANENYIERLPRDYIEAIKIQLSKTYDEVKD